MIDPREVGGGAIPDLISDTATTATGSLPGISADSPASDPAGLIDALRLWLENDDLVASGLPVAFVIVDSLRRLEGEEVLLFSLPNERSLVPGSVYLCSRGLGKALRIAGGVPIDELSTAISGLGFSNQPTVVYMPLNAMYAWLPQGMSEPDDRLEGRLTASGRDVDGAALSDLLDWIHTEHWRSPTAGGRIWHDTAGRVPVKQAEAVFQADVFLVCKLMFASHHAMAELSAVMGRCDIILLPKTTPPEPQGSAVIEMKVLRAFHFPVGGGLPTPVAAAENRKATRKGIGQAYLYGEEHGCTTRILCLCDMRGEDDDEVLRPYLPFATRHDILTKRLFMYATPDDLREAILQQEGLPPA